MSSLSLSKKLHELPTIKHVERIEVTTFIHEQVGDPEKENFDQVAIYTSEKGSIRRAFTFNTEIY